MPSFPKEVALAEEPAARQSVVGFLRNVNRKSTAVTQGRHRCPECRLQE